MNAAVVEWTARSYAVLDVEGNGRHPASLVELGVVPIDAGAIGAPSTWLVRPPETITSFATRIHGISNADVADRPVIAEVATGIHAALDGRVLVAHNAHVDLDVLCRDMPGWVPGPVLDTLRLSRALLGKNVSSHKLGALAGELGLTGGLPGGLRPHRADYDALICARLLVHLASVPGGTTAIAAGIRQRPTEQSGDDDAVLF